MVAKKVISFISFLLFGFSAYAEQINFQVQLNDKEIGFHEFNVQDDTVNVVILIIKNIIFGDGII